MQKDNIIYISRDDIAYQLKRKIRDYLFEENEFLKEESITWGEKNVIFFPSVQVLSDMIPCEEKNKSTYSIKIDLNYFVSVGKVDNIEDILTKIKEYLGNFSVSNVINTNNLKSYKTSINEKTNTLNDKKIIFSIEFFIENVLQTKESIEEMYNFIGKLPTT